MKAVLLTVLKLVTDDDVVLGKAAVVVVLVPAATVGTVAVAMVAAVVVRVTVAAVVELTTPLNELVNITAAPFAAVEVVVPWELVLEVV